MKFSKLLTALVITASCLTGCTSVPALPFVTDGREYKLNSKFAPLKAVEEATDKLFVEGMTTTIGNYCYVPDLKKWRQFYPDGSVQQDALLYHEQVHAKRQLGYPITLWLARYVTEPSFRWEEEKLGYEAEFRYLYKNGILLNPEAFAIMVSHDYKILGQQMVTYKDALDWINGLIWKIQNGQ